MATAKKVKKLSEGQKLMKLSRDREAKRTYRERRREAGLSEVTVWVTEEQREVVLKWQSENLERVVKGEAAARRLHRNCTTLRMGMSGNIREWHNT
ncbi:MAG: hypothetical protein ACYCS8_18380 [Acidithiobacillus sp.]